MKAAREALARAAAAASQASHSLSQAASAAASETGSSLSSLFAQSTPAPEPRRPVPQSPGESPLSASEPPPNARDAQRAPAGGTRADALKRFVAEEAPHFSPTALAVARRLRSGELRREFLNAAPESYTEAAPVELLLATLNVNGRAPAPGLDLRPWLHPESTGEHVSDDGLATHADGTVEEALTSAPRPRPGLVAVVFQEIVPLTAANVLTGGEAKEAVAPWDALVRAALDGVPPEAGGVPGGYLPLAAKQLVGCYLTIWATPQAALAVTDLRTAAVSTGYLFNLLGNKGACAAFLRVHDTPIALIGVHLSSGESEAAAGKRAADAAEILGKLSWAAPEGLSEEEAAVEEMLEAVEAAFFFGDLNCRTSLGADAAFAAAAAGDFSPLAAADQLPAMLLPGAPLAGWREPRRPFAPTYKFRRGTDVYAGAAGSGEAGEDGDGEEGEEASEEAKKEASEEAKKEAKKRRAPAWTDRILFHTAGEGAFAAVTPGPYASHPAVRCSDHKPVSARFALGARRVLPERLNDAVAAARRRLDAAANASVPKVLMERPGELDFGVIRLGGAASAAAVLRNTGDVTATWRWARASSHPPWLALDPRPGRERPLLPGDSVRLSAAAALDARALKAAGVPLGGADLSTVLIVRIAGGADLFLPLSAAYAGSAFCQPLAALRTVAYEPAAWERYAAVPPPDGCYPEPERCAGPAAVAALLHLLLAGCSGGDDVATAFTAGAAMAAAAAEGDTTAAAQLASARDAADAESEPPQAAVAPAAAAAALLALFTAAPECLLPSAVADVCGHALPPSPEAAFSMIELGCEACSTDLAALAPSIVAFVAAALRPSLRASPAAQRRCALLLMQAWLPPGTGLQRTADAFAVLLAAAPQQFDEPPPPPPLRMHRPLPPLPGADGAIDGDGTGELEGPSSDAGGEPELPPAPPPLPPPVPPPLPPRAAALPVLADAEPMEAPLLASNSVPCEDIELELPQTAPNASPSPPLELGTAEAPPVEETCVAEAASDAPALFDAADAPPPPLVAQADVVDQLLRPPPPIAPMDDLLSLKPSAPPPALSLEDMFAGLTVPSPPPVPPPVASLAGESDDFLFGAAPLAGPQMPPPPPGPPPAGDLLDLL